MKGLLFLARLALICNVLFLVCLGMQRTHDFIASQDIKGVILVLGWILAPFINLAANMGYLIRLMRKRATLLPAWLAITNMLFLFLEIFIHFILPA
jgi:hypothetical protein